MKPARVIGLVVAAAVIVAVARTAFFIVDHGEAAVVTQFGKPVRVVDGPGLYVKAPVPLEGVTKYDRRLAVWDSGPNEYATADSARIVLAVYAAWRIADPGKFALATGTRQRAEARLSDVVASELGAVVARHPMSAFASTQQADLRLPEILRTAMRGSQEALATAGIGIADFGATRVGLADGARDVVIGRMVAEHDARAALEIAAGEEEAARIRAAADSERQEVLADARIEAERIRAEADAAAMRIYADAQKVDPEFYMFLRTLDSYGVIMNDRTTLVLSSESELFNLLDGKD